MGSRQISWVKAHLAQVVAEARESAEPLIITQNGEETAVVLDVDTWKRTRQALLMLKLIAMSERQIEQGKTVPQAQVFRGLREELTGRQRGGRRR